MFINGICWSILNGGNFYVDPLSTLVFLSCMLDYKPVTWHLAIIFLQLVVFRQSRYTYLYEFLLEPVYFFDTFWSSAAWVCKLIAKRQWDSEEYYNRKRGCTTIKEKTDEELKRRKDGFLASRDAAFESWRPEKQKKYWKKADEALRLRKEQQKDSLDAKSKGQQHKGHSRAESVAEKERKEEARVMGGKRKAALDAEARRTVENLMNMYREHEAELSTASTQEYKAEVKDKLYKEVKDLGEMLWDEMQQREVEAEEREERTRQELARRKKRLEEEAELRAQKDLEEQEEASKVLAGEMYWEGIMDMQWLDRIRYGRVYQVFVKGCENFARSPEVFPPFGSYSCGKERCTKYENLAVCGHNVEKTFRGSGQYSEEFLQQQRRTWHPDKFSGRGSVQVKAKELFQIIGNLKWGPDI